MADLQQVLRDLLLRSGLKTSQINVEAVKGRLHGVQIGQRTTLHQAVSQLQQFFQLDAFEHNGRLTFTPRGRAIEKTIHEDKTIDGIVTERLSEVNLPQQLDVVYLDAGADYQTSVQTALRQTGFSQNKQSLKTVVALDSATASQQAQTLLDASWIERFRFRFAVGIEFLSLQVGDVIQLNMRSGKTWTVRLIKVLTQEYTIEIEAVSIQESVYKQPARAVDAIINSAVQLAKPSNLYILDIPLVNNSVDTALYYLAVTKQPDDQSWQYATVFEAENIDNQTPEYVPQTVITSNALAGHTENVLAAPIHTAYLDYQNSVIITLDEGQLQSTDKLSLLNGANSAVLGNEIIQFISSELVGERQYRLSGLLRGRRGTEWAVSDHSAGEPFVLLGDEIKQIETTPEKINRLLSLKSVSSGATLEAAEAYAFAPQAINLKPYAPVHLHYIRQGDDLIIHWIRRTRFNGGWQDKVDVPYAEATEAYTIDVIYNNEIKRTVETSLPTYIYTAAQQMTDFGILAPVATEIIIYQRSAIIGRGYGATLTIEN